MNNDFYWLGFLFGLFQLILRRDTLLKNFCFKGDCLSLTYMDLLFRQQKKDFAVSKISSVYIHKSRILPLVVQLDFEYEGRRRRFFCLLKQEEELRAEVWKLPCV